jgi:hypothetical protein
VTRELKFDSIIDLFDHCPQECGGRSIDTRGIALLPAECTRRSHAYTTTHAQSDSRRSSFEPSSKSRRQRETFVDSENLPKQACFPDPENQHDQQ